jgi:hypothetical protein
MSETKTLHAPGAGFPVAVARTGDIPNFAELAAQRAAGREYGFAMNPDNVAEALELLAARVRSRHALPQAMTDATTATVDDFVLHTLTFVFAQRHDAEQE